MTLFDVAQEIGKAVYGTALIVLGGAFLYFLPRTLSAASALTAALTASAAALVDAAASHDKVEQIAEDVTTIKQAVAELKAVRGVDPELLERVERALERTEGMHSGTSGKVVQP